MNTNNASRHFSSPLLLGLVFFLQLIVFSMIAEINNSFEIQIDGYRLDIHKIC